MDNQDAAASENQPFARILQKLRFPALTSTQAQWLIILLSLTVGFISQYPGLINKHVIEYDSTQSISWMHQFSDPGLFKDDLLTLFAKSLEPQGYIFLYRAFSYVLDLLLFSKLLSICLFVIAALFLFKFVTSTSNISCLGTNHSVKTFVSKRQLKDTPLN